MGRCRTNLDSQIAELQTQIDTLTVSESSKHRLVTPVDAANTQVKQGTHASHALP
ncbi:hypothetical protein BgiMline_029687, partial [Biomphalaria glabrata]